MKTSNNEKADFLAKKATKKSKNAQIDGYSSFSCISRLLKNLKVENTRNWLLKKQEKRRNSRLNQFEPEIKVESLTANKKIFKTSKRLSTRFFQLKIGHAITAVYLKRIGKSEFSNCWWCSNRNQTIEHLLFECSKWRKERKKFYSKLEESKTPRLRNNDKEAKFKLFNNSKAFKAILAFLNRGSAEVISASFINRSIGDVFRASVIALNCLLMSI
jgi:hypothetical protein